MTNIVILIVCGFLALLCLNEYYYRVVLHDTQEHKIMRARKKRNLDWISFGSSYCRFGLTSGEDEVGFNFGVAAQFLYYSDKMLREYATSCLKNKGNVYLIIAYLVFAEVGQGKYGADRYQELLSKESLGDEYSFCKKMRLRFPLFFTFHPRRIKGILSHLIKGLKLNYNDVETNSATEEEMLQTAQERCKSWCEQFGLKDTNSASISDELEQKFSKTRDILTGMIQYCLNNDLRPILVVTPVSRIMRSQLSDAFLDKVLFDNIRMANKQNVPFLNYLDDEEIANDLSLYCNCSDFLNARGRKLFTEKLTKDTKSL